MKKCCILISKNKIGAIISARRHRKGSQKFVSRKAMIIMYIGIDLGGTNIAIGLVDEDGKILVQDSTPTFPDGVMRGYDEIVKDMADLSFKLMEKAKVDISDIKAAGIGSPGAINSKEGCVIYANNLGFHNAPLRKELQKYIGVPVAVENDANAAAFGEYKATGSTSNSFVAVTLGTGVGGGIVINGEIFRGFNGAAGEVGHTTLVTDGVLCSCGKKGCWEAYASVTALIRQTKVAIEQHPESLMAEHMKKNNNEVSGRTAFDAAKKGDKVAQAVVDRYVRYVADGVTDMINIFEPEILVIGGGISREGEYLVEPVREYVKANGYNKGDLSMTTIQAASLLNDAGIVGAALAAQTLVSK